MNVHSMQGVSMYGTKVEERKANQELGKDDFLQLLVAQMRNQDPLNPASDTEMIAQMAQFSLLEQMKTLNQSFMSAQAFQLIGKTVYAESYQEHSGELMPVYGSVDRVSLREGRVMLGVNGIEVPFEDVREVFADNE
jgi:flagellar basal-body rod modification protein FlgD